LLKHEPSAQRPWQKTMHRADFARTRSLVPDVENLPRWLARQPDFG
jgi:hypothetical protein